MNGNWKDLLSFNARERNGILVLSTIIVALIVFQYVMTFFVKTVVEIDTSKLDAYVVQLQKDSADWVAENKLKYQNKYKSKRVYTSAVAETKKMEARYFDPNNATEEDWNSVGIIKGQILAIHKYLNKGGEFLIKSDVAKMYVIDEIKFEKMKPYLLLPDSINPEVKEKKKSNATSSTKQTPKNYAAINVELNSADTTQLIQLRGVGSYYARQIVYYRDKLGGFYSIEQLFEIEHMREETVIKIMPFVTIDTTAIRKIHINSDKASLMVQHPYMTWNMAKTIQDRRDFDKRFKSVRELVDLGLLNEELYTKLVAYLEL